MYTREQFLTSLRSLQDQFNANALKSSDQKFDVKQVQRDFTQLLEEEADQDVLETECNEHSRLFKVVTELALTNTLICMAIAHSRGVIHAKTLFSGKTGHEVDIKDLESQIYFIKKFTNTYPDLFSDLKTDLLTVATTPKEVKDLPPKAVEQNVPVEEQVFA